MNNHEQLNGFEGEGRENTDAVFTEEELKKLIEIKEKRKAGVVGGEEDEQSLDLRIKELRSQMMRRFNRLETLKWEAEHGKGEEAEARDNLEYLPSREELLEHHQSPGALDDESADKIREMVSIKKEEKASSVRHEMVGGEIPEKNAETLHKFVSEWNEAYPRLTAQDKKWIVALLCAYDSKEVVEEIVKQMNVTNGDAAPLRELYVYFSQSIK